MSPIFHLNYKIDKEKLLEEALATKADAKSYTDSRYPGIVLNDWKIRHYTSQYTDQIIKDFDVTGRSRFYWLEPFGEVPEHVDNGTQCSLNFILTDHASPIRYGDQEYFYQAALINTAIPHSVKNKEHERIIFKISIFNETFQEVAEKIKRFIK